MDLNEVVAILGIWLPLIGNGFGKENFEMNTANKGKMKSIMDDLNSINKKLDKIMEVLKIGKD